MTQEPDDRIPFASLGNIAAGETKPIEPVFSFEFEEMPMEGVLNIIPGLYTLESAGKSIPEPGAETAIVVAGGLALLLKWKTR